MHCNRYSCVRRMRACLHAAAQAPHAAHATAAAPVLAPPLHAPAQPLQTAPACRHLTLSTNNIEKISSLAGMDNLRILSLGRNLIKKVRQRAARIHGAQPPCAIAPACACMQGVSVRGEREQHAVRKRAAGGWVNV